MNFYKYCYTYYHRHPSNYTVQSASQKSINWNLSALLLRVAVKRLCQASQEHPSSFIHRIRFSLKWKLFNSSTTATRINNCGRRLYYVLCFLGFFWGFVFFKILAFKISERISAIRTLAFGNITILLNTLFKYVKTNWELITEIFRKTNYIPI